MARRFRGAARRLMGRFGTSRTEGKIELQRDAASGFEPVTAMLRTASDEATGPSRSRSVGAVLRLSVSVEDPCIKLWGAPGRGWKVRYGGEVYNVQPDTVKPVRDGSQELWYTFECKRVSGS